jgi:hypothetical protein
MTAFVPQKFSKRTLTKLDQINVLLPLVSREYEGEIKQEGDTVWVRTYGDVVTGTYTRGMPINYQALSPTRETMVIDDAEYFAFSLDDLDDAQMDLKALDGYTDRAAVAMNEVVERKLQARYVQAHASNRITDSSNPITLSTANAYTLIVDAGKALDDQKAPADGRWMLITPTWKSFLLKDTTYLIRATDIGDSVIRSGKPGTKAKDAPGFFGQVGGFDLYLTTAAPTDGAGKRCMFGQGKPINYAGQIRKVQKIVRESTFGTAVRGLILHGAEVFDEYQKRLGTVYVNG